MSSADTPFSPALQELLTRALRSIEELDLLLYLQREARACSALELATALSLAENTTVIALQNLVLRQLVQEGDGSPPHYALAPERSPSRAAIEELAHIYEERRLDILRLISSEALERVRSGARRAFGDPLGTAGAKRK